MEKIREGESQQRGDAGAQKSTKVAKHCVFPLFCGSGGSKSRLTKAAGAEPARQMRDEKLHAAVTQSTFGSQKCQNSLGVKRVVRRRGFVCVRVCFLLAVFSKEILREKAKKKVIKKQNALRKP